MKLSDLTDALNSLLGKLTGVNKQLEKAKAEIASKQPHPQAPTDFRIPPHMRQRLRRTVGR